MRDSLLLVVGDRIDGQLLEAVQAAGHTAVFMKSMGDALDHIRHGGFAAVVVDCRSKCDDVLEFALNVRDFRRTIPLVVIGPCGGDDAAQAMFRQPYTKLLGTDTTAHEWAAAMDALLSKNDDLPAGPGAAHPPTEQQSDEGRDP